MKRIIALISSLTYLFLPRLAFAEETSFCPEEGSGFEAFCTITSGDFGPIIGTAIIVVFIIAIIIALIWLVMGGIKWITSSGDSAKVETARNQIIAAIIGLIIVFLSFFILNFVLGLFGLKLTEINIPTLPGFGGN